MKTIVRNIGACILGIVIGSAVNIGIVMIGPALIPPPAGVDVTNAESIAASMHLYEPRHFLTPFLAHALGTLVGAFTAYWVAATHRTKMAYVVGFVFLAGGVSASFMIPAPTWFIATDLLLAYIPMAFIGATLGQRLFDAPAADA